MNTVRFGNENNEGGTMGYWADLFGLNKWCTPDGLPFDIKYYLMITGFFPFVAKNVDRIIWDRSLKKYLGLALLNEYYPPKKIKVRDDPYYIKTNCYGRRDIFAIDYSALIIHESSHWDQFLKTRKTDEYFPQYTEARFMEVLSRKLRNKPFEIIVPSLDGQRPWMIQYYGSQSKGFKLIK
jgi:hypothetical protein